MITSILQLQGCREQPEVGVMFDLQFYFSPISATKYSSAVCQQLYPTSARVCIM